MKEFILDITREAGAIAKEYFYHDFVISEKDGGHRDIVTEADTAVNKYLVDTILKEYPDHNITSEEQKDVRNAASEYEWIIDPIDGTWNFAHGVPIWAVMVSVAKADKPLYTAIYFPASEQLFFADEEKSYLNGKELFAKSDATFDQSMGKWFACKPYGPYCADFERFHTAASRYYADHEYHSKELGAAASICFIATGAFNYAVSNGGLIWDFWGPLHVARNAGAIITDSRGEAWERGKQEYVISTSTDIHKSLLALFD